MFVYVAASGQFTYWSMRTRARPFNKGLRLDYFVCSQEMFDTCSDDVKIEVEKIENEIKDELAIEKLEEEKEIVALKGKGGRKRKIETTTAAAAVPQIAEEKTILTDNLILQKKYENPRNVKVTDSYILYDINDCSDHCPITLILQLQPPMEKLL